MNESVFLVVPTIRTLDFFKDWGEEFDGVSIIICEDHKEIEIETPKVGKEVFHYSWKEIDADLGKDSWIVPRKVSGIRNYGFLKAYEMGADVIITLDDDCYPVKQRTRNQKSKNKHNDQKYDFVGKHLMNLSLSVPRRWVNTYPDARYLYTRGMPYLNRKESSVKVSHGLWTNVLDFDAPTQLQHLDFKAEFAESILQIIPEGAYYPMCSMNLAFTREMTPLMYFPLMGEDNNNNEWGYNRFDDIWAGIFSKKIMDHLGYGVVSGAPFVEHRKASNVFKNLVNEARGIGTNENLWKLVDEVKLTKKTVSDCYIEIAEKIKFPDEEYFVKLKEAMIIWAKLFTL